MDLLRKKGVTYRNIVDGSDAAHKIAYRVFKANSVPTNYIIDREGRIAGAWPGYRNGDRRGTNVLEKLGIGRRL